MSHECISNFEPPKRENHALVPISHGEERCTPNHSWGAGVRSHYLIHYVISGKGIFYCGTNKFRLQKGQLFIIFPGTILKYQADDKTPWHYSWVSFYGDEAKEVFSKLNISINSPILTVENGSELLEVLREMPTERCADIRSNLRFSSKLYEFMSLIAANQGDSKKNEDSYLTTARRYIKAHYSEDITVDSVSFHIGISRKYLFAIFKNALGISPKEYILNYRMSKAIEFLKDPCISIGNVAYSVGYKDPLTFSKIFKQKTGSSPSEYRIKFLNK